MLSIPQVKTVTTSNEVMDFISTVIEDNKAEEKEREFIQAKVDAKFTWLEQSLIWQCLNDKDSQSHHEMFNSLIRKHMSTSVPDLWRGVTRIEAHKLMDIAIGEEFSLNRVTSFSADYEKAREFAGTWVYASNIILELKNPGWAYNYYADIIDILLGAPDSEFGHEEREEKIDMVESEQEFMLPVEARFKLLNIIQENKNPDYNIYQIELLEW